MSICPYRLFVALAIHALAATFIYNNIYLEGLYWQLPIVIGLVLLQVFTVSTFLHKMLSHRVWKFKYKAIDWFFATFAMTIGHVFPGDPLTWSVIHRLHHAHVDKDMDPHSPSRVGLLVSHFHLWKPPVWEDVDRKYYFDLMKHYRHLFFFSQYPIVIAVALWTLVFLLFGIEGVALLGMASFIEFHGLGVIDAYSHAEGEGKTRSIPWWLVALGLNDPEGSYHKEHHDHPDVYSFNPTWIDYPSRIMEILSTIGLVEIRGRKFKNRNEVFEGKV